MSREIPIPVYLTFDGENAKQLKAAVERGAGDTQLVVNKKQDPVKVVAPVCVASASLAWVAANSSVKPC